MTAALLVVAMQVSLLENETPDPDRLMPVVVGLVQRARAEGVPVVWVADQSVSPDPQIHPVFRPKPGEAVLKPDTCDAFRNSELAGALGGREVERLVVCGLRSQRCIARTVRQAPGYGFPVALVEDGHAPQRMDSRDPQEVIDRVNAEMAALDDVTVVASGSVRFS